MSLLTAAIVENVLTGIYLILLKKCPRFKFGF